MTNPPLIGVTAANNPQTPEHYILRWDYVHSLAAVGGIPVILAPSVAAEKPGYLDNFAGIIFSGGRDIDPEFYHQEPGPVLTPTSRERDEFELGLARAVLERGIPVLGICRGMQLLNVVLGGDLVQHLPEAVGESIVHDDPNRPRTTLAHEVAVVPGSRLHRALGAARVRVNSFHHQAIDRLGDGLEVSAIAADGVIEAVEGTGGSFVMGVQWHPESLWNRGGMFLPLFRALVEAAAAREGEHPPNEYGTMGSVIRRLRRKSRPTPDLLTYPPWL